MKKGPILRLSKSERLDFKGIDQSDFLSDAVSEKQRRSSMFGGLFFSGDYMSKSERILHVKEVEQSDYVGKAIEKRRSSSFLGGIFQGPDDDTLSQSERLHRKEDEQSGSVGNDAERRRSTSLLGSVLQSSTLSRGERFHAKNYFYAARSHGQMKIPDDVDSTKTW